MEWQEVVAHPSLQDLPFKIETNQWGQIVMTPASGKHGRYQGRIIELFLRLGEWGRVFPECPIKTPEGVRVADVAWASAEFLKKYGAPLCFPESPEIVVEVISRSNSDAQMEHKRRLYFQAGAKEFWICDESGDMRFFTPGEELEKSGLFRLFPEHVDIEI